MKTSPTDGDAATLVLFADGAGAVGRWLLLETGGAAASGEGADALPRGWARAVLVVPGEEVALHWVELAEGLTPAQAAAAARLMLADASAEPIADMHVAVGRTEAGLRPAALVPTARMARWVDGAAQAGVEPELVIPSPLLLAPPAEGFVSRANGTLADYRAEGAAFTLEPELAQPLVEGRKVETLSEAGFEAGLAGLLADPPLNLRQGAFARRRQWQVERSRMRRIAAFAVALALLSLVVQVATILSYTFAADRMEAEAAAIAPPPGAAADARPGFGATAAALFEAVRGTPNVEVARIDYRADGSLTATVMIDSPATLAALEARLQAAGLDVEPGEPRTAGGRPAADLTVRPA